MAKRCEQVAILPSLNGYDCLKRVYSDEGICPTIPTGMGGNVMPKILIRTDKEFLRIRDGTTYAEAEEGDGIKLIFPLSPLSVRRVRKQISPTLMGGPVVGVVVRDIRQGKNEP